MMLETDRTAPASSLSNEGVCCWQEAFHYDLPAKPAKVPRPVASKAPMGKGVPHSKQVLAATTPTSPRLVRHSSSHGCSWAEVGPGPRLLEHRAPASRSHARPSSQEPRHACHGVDQPLNRSTPQP